MKIYVGVIIGTVVTGIIAVTVWGYRKAFNTYDRSEPAGVYIPEGVSSDSIRVVLCDVLGDSFGGDIYSIFDMRGGSPQKAWGYYEVKAGDRAWSVANRLRTGTQTPRRVTFNNIRTMKDLALRVADRFVWDADDFLAAADSVLPTFGFSDQRQFPAAFVPDTYEFYYTTPAADVVRRLAEYRNRFWNDERREKASALGLSPAEIATVASIVEEETAKKDERGMVARLYLNRLSKGMRLQADPTVKFAAGDFSLRRIGGDLLRLNSPYNTYVVAGLPPGPIRIPEKSTIDAVLNAPRHNYLYMCAKSDFSGYHDFAVDYDTHLSNAAVYQAELDRRGIKL